MSRRVLSTLTPELGLALERDVLKRDDVHLVAARSIDELVTLARSGAAACLVEPLLPDGDALDALDALRAIDGPPIPVVLIAWRDAPRRSDLDEGFAAVIQMPDADGAFAEVMGRLLGAPRRNGSRRSACARVLDEAGAPLGRVVDLSSGGLAVRTRRTLTVGETLGISLELVARDLTLSTRVAVVRTDGEVAALRFEKPSAELSSALDATLATHLAPHGFSFRPSPERGARAAAIGGSIVEGPAWTALLELMLEGDRAEQPRLALHDLTPLDEAGVTRFIELIAELAGIELFGCPPWFIGLAARMPALLGRASKRAKICSARIALRCPTCRDELEDEARWATPAEAAAAITACLGRPCYVCGGAVALEEPIEIITAALSK